MGLVCGGRHTGTSPGEMRRFSQYGSVPTNVHRDSRLQAKSSSKELPFKPQAHFKVIFTYTLQGRRGSGAQGADPHFTIQIFTLSTGGKAPSYKKYADAISYSYDQVPGTLFEKGRVAAVSVKAPPNSCSTVQRRYAVDAMYPAAFKTFEEINQRFKAHPRLRWAYDQVKTKHRWQKSAGGDTNQHLFDDYKNLVLVNDHNPIPFKLFEDKYLSVKDATESHERNVAFFDELLAMMPGQDLVPLGGERTSKAAKKKLKGGQGIEDPAADLRYRALFPTWYEKQEGNGKQSKTSKQRKRAKAAQLKKDKASAEGAQANLDQSLIIFESETKKQYVRDVLRLKEDDAATVEMGSKGDGRGDQNGKSVGGSVKLTEWVRTPCFHSVHASMWAFASDLRSHETIYALRVVHLCQDDVLTAKVKDMASKNAKHVNVVCPPPPSSSSPHHSRQQRISRWI